MTEHHYKNCKIEVHTERVGSRWDWWFVLNDRPPRYSAEQYAPSESEALAEALEIARRMIDKTYGLMEQLTRSYFFSATSGRFPSGFFFPSGCYYANDQNQKYLFIIRELRIKVGGSSDVSQNI